MTEIGNLFGDISGMLPDISKSDAIKILSYRHEDTKIFAQLLVDFKDEINIVENEDDKDGSEDNKSQMMALIPQLGRMMPNLNRQHRNLLENPRFEETKLFVNVIKEIENDVSEEYRKIVVKNLEYIAVGIETNAKGTKNKFNEMMSVFSSRDHDKIKNYLITIKDKGLRLFALKMLLMIGYKIETNDKFRDKANHIIDRFAKFYGN